MTQPVDLSILSADELKAELARREEAAKPKLPDAKPLEEVDWSAVYRNVVDGVAAMQQRQFEDEDLDGYISEAAFEAVYGKKYWEWRRAQEY